MHHLHNLSGKCEFVIQECEAPDVAVNGRCILGEVTQEEYCKDHPNTLDRFVEGDPKDCTDIFNSACNWCEGLKKVMTCYSDCTCTLCERSKGFYETAAATDTSDRECKECKY